MDRTSLLWVGAAVTALVAAVAVGVRGLPEARVPEPEPFLVAEDVEAGTPRSRRPQPRSARPLPKAPRQAPEGAAVLDSTGVSLWDAEPGVGEPAREGQIVVLEFTGFLADGTIFDSSYMRVDPFRFVIGGGRVIPGQDLALRGMRPGGVRQAVIPPDQAYGARGIPMRVPPSATVTYDFELLDVLELPVEPPAGLGADIGRGVYVLDVKKGEGPVVEPGRTIVMDYVLWLEDELRIETSLERATPLEIKAGTRQLFPGWDSGVMGMAVGGHRKITCPPEQAFGKDGKPPVIPADATIVVEMWLRRME